MGFLDDMAKKVGSVATEAGSKAKDVAGIAKLSAEIGSKEREIEKIYTEIGKVAYEYFKDDMPEDIKARIEKIDTIKEEIEGLNSQIAEIKNSWAWIRK